MTKMTSQDASKQAACNQQSLLVYPPTIPFKKDKKELEKEEKEGYKTIELDLCQEQKLIQKEIVC